VIRWGALRRTTSMPTVRGPLVVAVLAAALVVPTTAGAAGARPARTVTLEDISFTPATVRIHPGQQVRWIWKDGTIPHDVTFRGRASATKATGTWTRTFTAAGTYRYHCTLHPGMDGKVVVVPR
jgi:plastocyanin